MNLSKLLVFFRGNKSKVAKLLRIERLTLRKSMAQGRDYIIVDGMVYKSMRKINLDHLSEIERLRLEDHFNSECG